MPTPSVIALLPSQEPREGWEFLEVTANLPGQSNVQREKKIIQEKKRMHRVITKD